MKEKNKVEELFLLFVRLKGVEQDGRIVYQFIFGTEEQCNNFWVDGFEEKPSGIAGEFYIEDEQYTEIRELKVYGLKLDLAQNNLCFSMQDCRDGCIALAWENLDNPDDDPDFEYPEEGRLVFKYGMTEVDVELILAKRNLLMSLI